MNARPDRITLARGPAAMDVVNGLGYLHSISIAHGDLKPENVLVGADGHACLCDFGMSQFIEGASRIAGLTTTNASGGGTDRFMSPELLEDMPKTKATDIWALACLIVQILTDKIPYHHISRKQAVMVAIVRGEPPVSKKHESIDAALWGCIQKCWSLVPGDRPSVSLIGIHLKNLEYSIAVSGLRQLTCLTAFTHPHFSDLSRIDLSTDGNFAAIVSDTGTVSIWDIRKEVVSPIKSWVIEVSGNDHMLSIAWDNSQQHLLVQSFDLTRVYNIETCDLILDIGVTTMARFTSKDGMVTFMASEALNKACFQYLPAHEPTSHTMPKIVGDIDDIAFTPDHQRAILATPCSLVVYNLCVNEIETIVDLPDSHESCIKRISLSKDGRFALVSYDQQEPQIWEISGLGTMKTALYLLYQYSVPHSGSLWYHKVQFGGVRDQLILAQCNDDLVYIWDRDIAALVHSLRLANEWRIRDMSFTWNSTDPQDMRLAFTLQTSAQSNLHAVQIWSVLPRNCI
ncbi:mitogen-activated protein kinase kinase kinase 9 [Tulasnella sp. 419]|nr:mitogen-activated protein kinase kinase kinase 9 [Tulasnella sp. 419]